METPGDIYAGIIDFSHEQIEKMIAKCRSLVEENHRLHDALSECRSKVSNMEKSQTVLKRNFDSLLQTAKAEVNRKDERLKEAQQLLQNRAARPSRAEIEQLSNHGGKYRHSKVKILSSSPTSSAQTQVVASLQQEDVSFQFSNCSFSVMWDQVAARQHKTIPLTSPAAGDGDRSTVGDSRNRSPAGVITPSPVARPCAGRLPGRTKTTDLYYKRAVCGSAAHRTSSVQHDSTTCGSNREPGRCSNQRSTVQICKATQTLDCVYQGCRCALHVSSIALPATSGLNELNSGDLSAHVHRDQTNYCCCGSVQKGVGYGGLQTSPLTESNAPRNVGATSGTVCIENCSTNSSSSNSESLAVKSDRQQKSSGDDTNQSESDSFVHDSTCENMCSGLSINRIEERMTRLDNANEDSPIVCPSSVESKRALETLKDTNGARRSQRQKSDRVVYDPLTIESPNNNSDEPVKILNNDRCRPLDTDIIIEMDLHVEAGISSAGDQMGRSETVPDQVTSQRKFIGVEEVGASIDELQTGVNENATGETVGAVKCDVSNKKVLSDSSEFSGNLLGQDVCDDTVCKERSDKDLDDATVCKERSDKDIEDDTVCKERSDKDIDDATVCKERSDKDLDDARVCKERSDKDADDARVCKERSDKDIDDARVCKERLDKDADDDTVLTTGTDEAAMLGGRKQLAQVTSRISTDTSANRQDEETKSQVSCFLLNEDTLIKTAAGRRGLDCSSDDSLADKNITFEMASDSGLCPDRHIPLIADAPQLLELHRKPRDLENSSDGKGSDIELDACLDEVDYDCFETVQKLVNVEEATTTEYDRQRKNTHAGSISGSPTPLIEAGRGRSEAIAELEDGEIIDDCSRNAGGHRDSSPRRTSRARLSRPFDKNRSSLSSPTRSKDCISKKYKNHEDSRRQKAFRRSPSKSVLLSKSRRASIDSSGRFGRRSLEKHESSRRRGNDSRDGDYERCRRVSRYRRVPILTTQRNEKSRCEASGIVESRTTLRNRKTRSEHSSRASIVFEKENCVSVHQKSGIFHTGTVQVQQDDMFDDNNTSDGKVLAGLSNNENAAPEGVKLRRYMASFLNDTPYHEDTNQGTDVVTSSSKPDERADDKSGFSDTDACDWPGLTALEVSKEPFSWSQVLPVSKSRSPSFTDGARAALACTSHTAEDNSTDVVRSYHDKGSTLCLPTSIMELQSKSNGGIQQRDVTDSEYCTQTTTADLHDCQQTNVNGNRGDHLSPIGSGNHQSSSGIALDRDMTDHKGDERVVDSSTPLSPGVDHQQLPTSESSAIKPVPNVSVKRSSSGAFIRRRKRLRLDNHEFTGASVHSNFN